MKVAVTGASGLIGRQLVSDLMSEGYEVIKLTSSKNKNGVYTDYSLDDLKNKLVDVNTVVHLAAKRGGEKEISRFVSDAVLTQNLYDACIHNDITNIIFASSISIYSNQDNMPWVENSIDVPISVYGINKLTCEKIGELYNQQYGTKIKNLRLAHVFGPFEKNNYMINKFIRQAFNKKELNVISNDFEKREFIYVKDVSNGIIQAIRKPDIYGNYNLGTNSWYTNEEVALIVNYVFQNDGNIRVTKKTDSKGSSSIMNSELSMKDLEYKSQFTLLEGMQDIERMMRGMEDVPEIF
ncbi:hypothetical protein T233_00625 [Vagococcus lutrae LBD1]|uniref:NAD-dependent epimerase/dehydratase domain-containing protein n=1 Tax=Vagococcus lutrae LBD1 TaxID=1408226 RepID=V6Q6C3_9ENTE|nr:SDR family oxidoreductase [Vagococcus lutrae]EST90322.1 hypothetical protein T233_00625 [Vagococcus lutrae LBD1]